jgi:hypothetical protein
MSTLLEFLAKAVFWLVVIVLGLVACLYVTFDVVPKIKSNLRPEILQYDRGTDGDTFQKRIDDAFPRGTPVKDVEKKLSTWGFEVLPDKATAKYRLTGFLGGTLWTIRWETDKQGRIETITGHASSLGP